MQFYTVSARSLFDIHHPLGTKLLTRALELVLVTCEFISTRTIFRIPLIQFSLVKLMRDTIEHYLLYCPDYEAHRQNLFKSLRKSISLVTFVNAKYICDLLLYGDPKYHRDTNKEIIKATIEFLISSKRFDTPLIEG